MVLLICRCREVSVEGTPFGQYRLITLLGRGGMGEVWRAYDTLTDRIVALKVLPAHFAADRTFQERFRREAHAAARLNDPHVVPIHTYGEIDGRLFVDMRLIEGRDLATVLHAGSMPPSRAVHIVEQVAHAVYAAHKIGLVHRDIKPSNILLDESDFAYLIDFGIARVVGETGLTGTDAVVGTLRYMAPERFRVGQADARSDIYALACVLYECLTGGAPFPGDSIEQQLAGHLSAPPPRPSDSGAPLAFDAVIATGMAKDPEQRYATPVEMARAARDAITVPLRVPDPNVQSHTVGAAARTQVASWPREPTKRAQEPLHRDPGPDAAGKRKRAKRSWVVATVIAVVVGLGGASLYLLRAHTSTPGSTRTTGSATAAIPPPAPSGGATPSGGVTAAPTGPPTIAGSIRVGNGAFGVAVDPDGHAAYVANSGSNSVSVVDTASRKVTATTAVGRRPVGLAVDPSTRTVYVTNYDDASVSVIDIASSKVIASIAVGTHPGGVVVDPDARIAYATNGDNASVSVIDVTTHTVTATVPTGKGPSRVAIDRTAHRLFVTTADPTVTVIDTTNRTVVGSVALRGRPAGIAIDTASHTAYIASGDDASVSFVDTVSLSVTASAPVGQRPAGVAVDPPTNTAYVANYSGASVSVIDTTRRVATGILAVGNNPLAIAVDPTTHFAYVTSDLNHGSVTVIER
jgi:serine/threonine protein kinase, bacterial